jgi:hypothetical protein
MSRTTRKLYTDGDQSTGKNISFISLITGMITAMHLSNTGKNIGISIIWTWEVSLPIK